jgi:hypothetical protein
MLSVAAPRPSTILICGPFVEIFIYPSFVGEIAVMVTPGLRDKTALLSHFSSSHTDESLRKNKGASFTCREYDFYHKPIFLSRKKYRFLFYLV